MITISAPKEELDRFRKMFDFCQFDEYKFKNCPGKINCKSCEYHNIEFTEKEEEK